MAISNISGVFNEKTEVGEVPRGIHINAGKEGGGKAIGNWE